MIHSASREKGNILVEGQAEESERMSVAIFAFVIIVIAYLLFKNYLWSWEAFEKSYFEYHFKLLVDPHHSICDFLKAGFCTLGNLLKARKKHFN